MSISAFDFYVTFFMRLCIMQYRGEVNETKKCRLRAFFCGRIIGCKPLTLRICGSGSCHYNYNNLFYFQEAKSLKIVLIENPKFISFFLRKIYGIKKQKPHNT